MKYDFDFSHMPDFVLIRTGKFAVVEDFYKLQKNLIESPMWVKGTNQIVDHRHLDLSKMSPEDLRMIRSIVEFHSAKLGNGKCAFIINGDLATLSAELYDQATEEPQAKVKIFSNLTDAKEWISN